MTRILPRFLALTLVVATAGCSGSKSADEPLTEEETFLYLLFSGLLGLPLDDDELAFLYGCFEETPIGDLSVHGTCETKPGQKGTDIVRVFSAVGALELDPDSPLVTDCGQVGEIFVACPPGQEPLPVDEAEYFVGMFELDSDDATYFSPRVSAQISLPIHAAGAEVYMPDPMYPCDTWGGASIIPHAFLMTSDDGVTFGSTGLSVADNGMLASRPHRIRLFLFGNAGLVVAPMSDFAGLQPHSASFAIHNGYDGSFSYEDFVAGQKQPAIGMEDPQVPGFPVKLGWGFPF